MLKLKNPIHFSSIEDAEIQLQTSVQSGLPSQTAHERISEYGENRLQSDKGVSAWNIFFRQVLNAMCVVLILAAALSFGTTDWIEGGVISAIIVLNVVVGFVQEYKAEKTMDSLRSLASPMAHVIRDGKQETIESHMLAPGDIATLKTGDVVPADIRLVETINFETDEALLTGESLPVVKNARAVFDTSEEVPVGDRINLAYSSSVVTKGRATGICYATGMNTEIGGIAASLRQSHPIFSQKPDPSDENYKKNLKTYRFRVFLYYVKRILGLNVGTPLQQKLTVLAYVLFIIAIVLAIVVMAAHTFHVSNEVSIYAISLGISIIPESLIAVLSITMALGQKNMSARRVIVRKLEALEALGGVTDICSDKTGTITQGKMITRRVWIPSFGFLVVETSSPFDPTAGTVSTVHQPMETLANAKNQKLEEMKDLRAFKELDPVLKISSLCNLSTVSINKEGNWVAKGEPTEIALHVFSSRFNYGREELLKSHKLLREYPFDSELKRMSVVMQEKESNPEVYAKGAVERVLERCKTIAAHPLDHERRNLVLAQMETLASQGLRVLALAKKSIHYSTEWEAVPREDVESNLDFVSLVGIYDPPRAESKEAVNLCHRAGIRVHMLTGDHPETAKAIAKEVGIIPPYISDKDPNMSWMIMTGPQFDALSDQEIDNMKALCLVIARCAPQTKVKMIHSLHRRKAYVAMTGDGVNDSPSLKQADVGIAMGLNGSDVAKDASDIVLTDDNFSSIVNAIEEGRRIFDNIMKFVLHLLISNVGEVILLVVGLAFRDIHHLSVFPMSPVEILWCNMITSSFPSMGLGMEKAQPDIMERLPHDNRVGVFTKSLIFDMIAYGLLIGVMSLMTWVVIIYAFGTGNLGYDCNSYYHDGCREVFRARSAVFCVVTFCVLIMGFEVKNFDNSFFNLDGISWREWTFGYFFRKLVENRFLVWAIALAFASVFPTIYIPVINSDVFKHKSIGWEWGVVAVAVILFFIFAESWKFIRRTLSKPHRKGKLRRTLSRTITSQSKLSETDLEKRLFIQSRNVPS
ncbi:P-type ATPase, potassium exporting Cta3 [Schizosaccharomyces osmophilus]|uniref:P-type Na(+) transporter n=1 Tax=Schizosaccharomyces osmophilus TaxID=2545709 RepID=A0AAE9W9I9_9SCHI|nr:P-type ATPase, potassium exporting Cta3 [Schizosaccharomyces osmophilus]WBW71301.1 P-type ATPase, potassium exporting Cta3 [Schizosaccharomyces osmophilus]